MQLYITKSHLILRIDNSTQSDFLVTSQNLVDIQAVIDVELRKDSCFDIGISKSRDSTLNFEGLEALREDKSKG